MVVTYANGTKLQCLLLSKGRNVFRVAVAGEQNFRIFRRIEGEWHTEDGQPVQVTPAGRDDIAFTCSTEQSQQLIARLIDDSEKPGNAPGPLFVFTPDNRQVQITVLEREDLQPC